MSLSLPTILPFRFSTFPPAIHQMGGTGTARQTSFRPVLFQGDTIEVSAAGKALSSAAAGAPSFTVQKSPEAADSLEQWWRNLDFELVIDRLPHLNFISAEDTKTLLDQTGVDPNIWKDVTGSPFPHVLEGIPPWDLVEMAAVLEQFLADHPGT